jgi:hypothetical protein
MRGHRQAIGAEIPAHLGFGLHKPDVGLGSLDCISDPAAVGGDAKGINIAPRAGGEYLTDPLGPAVDQMDLAIAEKQQPPTIG